jgi:hypothetical protein
MYLIQRRSEGICKKKWFLSLNDVRIYVKENPGWELYKATPVFEGWIEKKGDFNKERKKRYLVLTKNRLIYYNLEKCGELTEKGEISLLQISYLIPTMTGKDGFTFYYEGRTYDFETLDKTSWEWYNCIRDVKQVFHLYVNGNST